jgi:putative phage-type endonuclease
MIEQGSAEWFSARLGCATASRIVDIMAKTKTGPSASRTSYAAQLVAERLTGNVEPSFSNAAMAWGTATEPQARNAYSYWHDVDVSEVGFILHPTIAQSGASPDGLIGLDGLLEIKAPNTSTHVDTLLRGTVPAKYMPQLQWQLSCTGRQWCDFASYDPRLPETMRLFVRRVPRDDEYIATLEAGVAEFLAEIAATIDALRDRYEPTTDILAA